ncbi:MAG TPA: hypothetical protein VLD37_01275 [Candidatus Bilamarchaeum sp.]|nr:hypothetical protein [Candidatus Bilamarchaeum sp.]
MDKEFPKYVLVSVLLFFAIFLAAQMLLPQTVPEGTDLLNYRYTEDTRLQLHIHPWLEIWIDGKNESIPANIGIDGGGIRVIHTHDETGKIHVESPWPHEFYLKDFFYIWGKRFDSECIFEFCTDANHTLDVYVDGARSGLYGDIPLEDGQKIKIVYSGRK